MITFWNGELEIGDHGRREMVKNGEKGENASFHQSEVTIREPRNVVQTYQARIGKAEWSVRNFWDEEFEDMKAGDFWR
jgi:hypothetical protein